MGKRLRKALPSRSRGAEFLYGVILLLFFAAGVLGGSYLCDRMDMAEELALYLSAFLAQVGEAFSVSVWTAAGLYFRYPLFALLLALLPAGFAVLPFFMFFIGGELSFSAAAFMSVFGRSGLRAAVCALGIRSALVIPCCFLIAFGALSRRQERILLKKEATRLMCVAGILGAGICFEVFLVPKLLTRVLAEMNF